MENKIPSLDRLETSQNQRLSPVLLDGESLTLDQVIAVAYGQPGNPKISLTPEAERNIQRSATAVETMLKNGQIQWMIGRTPVGY